mmetsp:Transcript_72137/g.204860  ORF Transcript_72137/g.204860 Transcript_72137/m.204860 type:complete len:242 (-) Transcript_72137:689-1414(-)
MHMHVRVAGPEEECEMEQSAQTEEAQILKKITVLRGKEAMQTEHARDDGDSDARDEHGEGVEEAVGRQRDVEALAHFEDNGEEPREVEDHGQEHEAVTHHHAVRQPADHADARTEARDPQKVLLVLGRRLLVLLPTEVRQGHPQRGVENQTRDHPAEETHRRRAHRDDRGALRRQVRQLVEECVEQGRQKNDIEHQKHLKSPRAVLGRFDHFEVWALPPNRRAGGAVARTAAATDHAVGVD